MHSQGLWVVITGLVVALALIVASPHIAFLKPIAQRLGLVQTQTIYVPVNHTVYVNRTIYINQTVIRYVYVNKTVPIYINRTVYVANMPYAGYCSGRLVILPNNTAWIVWFWLVPKSFIQNTLIRELSLSVVLWYNSTTHYAMFPMPLSNSSINFIFISKDLELEGSLFGDCFMYNVTVAGHYYIAVCGDVQGPPINGTPIFIFSTLTHTPIIWNGTEAYESAMKYIIMYVPNLAVVNMSGLTTFDFSIPVSNATYTGVMLIYYNHIQEVSIFPTQAVITLGPLCDLTVTFVSNATSALWLPVTNNQTLVDYWRYASDLTYGTHDPYDNLIGFWVWNYPS
jgi:hypothetical protein